MKYPTKISRRPLALILAALMVLGAVVPITLPRAQAMDLAEYEQKHYFRNESSPMDAPPETVTLSDTEPPMLGETNTVLSLDGTWEAVFSGKMSDLLVGRGWEDALDAAVPGSIYTALMDAGVIGDPYVGDNMKSANRYSSLNWYFRRTFTYHGAGERVELGFDGLCNVADVYLNGQKIASHEGMFGGPYVDVSDVIVQGENTVVVHLYPAKDYNSTVVFNCSYGWHYAKLYPLGIWQSVTVRDLPSVTLDSPFITTTDYTKGTIDLAIELDRGDAPTIAGELTVSISPKNFEGRSYSFTKEIAAGAVDSATLRYRTNIPEFRLWWPNGYGEQNLYNLEVSFKAEDGSVSYDTSSFGIRQLDYKAMPSGENQNSYNRQFVINGMDVYMKGAGWCTIDTLMRFEREDYDRLLSRARDAGINYLRAWGGGLVETEAFYDLCDEYGICVYQEWPCAWDSHKTQPASVLYETVELGAKRLRNRPSLVVWGGGNEGAAAFEDTVLNQIGKMTYEYDGTRDFWRQDGGTGGTNITHDHIHWSGASPEHYLKTYSNILNLNLTEYGAACMMNYESIQKYAAAEEMAEWPLDPTGTIAYHTATFNGMLGWNPSPHGYDLDTYTHYASMFTEVDSLQDLITGSQMAQAQADYLPAVNARINAPYSTANVVYKLNDNFPGASWSIIDWYGTPKMAYYLMQDAYRPLMAAAKMDRYNTMDASGQSSALTLPIYILDDVRALVASDWSVKVTAYGEDLQVVKSQTFDGKGVKATSHKVGDFALTAAETAHTPLVITVDLSVNGQYVNRTYAYLNFESDPGCLFYLPRTNLSYSVSGNTLTIRNTGTKPAVGVEVLAPATSDTFVTEDNFFWLDPGETVTLSVSDGNAVEGVTCMNLADPADKTAPTPPADVTVTEVTSDKATLTWTPSTDEGGLFGYTVTAKRANGQTTEVFVRDNKNTVTIGGLAELTTYTVTIIAVDDNGNRSAASEAVTVTTEADTTRPSVVSSHMREDGTITLTFDTPMDKTRAENPAHYLFAGDATVKSALLSPDGCTVTLTTEGVDAGRRCELVVVNLTDTKTCQNNIGAVTVSVDPGLILSLDFEPTVSGTVYTGGETQKLVTGVSGDLSLLPGGHIGHSLAGGTGAMVSGVDFAFNEGSTISLWVRGRAADGFGVLIAKGAKTTGHFEIYTRSGQLCFYAPDIGDFDLGYNMNTLPDGWHNLTFLRTEGKIVTYADGKKVASVTCRGHVAEKNTDLSVGALNDGTLMFAGSVDTVRLYDRLLSEEEMAAFAASDSAYAEVEGNDIGNRGTTEFSLASGSTVNLWFYPDAFENRYAVFLAKGSKSSNRHFELYTENGMLRLYAPGANGGNPVVFGVDMRPYVGGWHMLTLVYASRECRVYMDGHQVTSLTVDLSIPSGKDSYIYGRLVEGGMDFAGKIAEGELLSEALTPEAIRARYEAKLVKFEADAGLSFAEDLLTLTEGESASVELRVTGDVSYRITLMGDSVTLRDQTVTAQAIGDSVLCVRSEDGAYLAAMVIRVVEKTSETAPDTPPDTTPDPDPDSSPAPMPDTHPAPDTNPIPDTDRNTRPIPNDGTQAPATQPNQSSSTDQKGGCRSVVGISVVAFLSVCGVCLLGMRKREAEINDRQIVDRRP